MTHTNFQIDILKKNLGKKFPPGGSDPQIFYKSTFSSPMAMRLCNFIAISQKLWPVATGNGRPDKQRKKKQKNKVVDAPPKPEVLLL
jgi:hypothetical protein